MPGTAGMLAPHEWPLHGRAAQRDDWTVTHAWCRYWGSGEYDQAIDELAAAAPRTTRGRTLVAGTRAWLLLYSGRTGAAVTQLAAISAGARAAAGWPFPVAAAVHACALAGLPDAALALAETATSTARSGVAIWDEVMLSWARCQALLASGQIGEAEREAEDRYGLVAANGLDGSMLAIGAVLRGRAAAARGRLAAARDALHEAATLLAERDYYQFSRYVLAELAGVSAQAGDAAAAAEWMDRADRCRSDANRMFEPGIELRRAWVIAVGGELASAARQARFAADLAQAAGQHSVQAMALYDAARFGPAGPAVGPLSRLAEISQGALIPALARAAAALAAADGHLLDAAAAEMDRLGLAVHVAELAGAAARAHRSRGRGLAAERALGLTCREREVALMAAAGMASKVIAAKLELSVRTVSNHLGHIYAKLGITSRAELTALLTPADR